MENGDDHSSYDTDHIQQLLPAFDNDCNEHHGHLVVLGVLHSSGNCHCQEIDIIYCRR
jgi:hypothetical protein